MNTSKLLKCICLIGLALLSVVAEDALAASESAFNISRGVNISHWLSQSRSRAQQRRSFFTEKDVRLIAGLGYDHIRLPIDEEQLWDENGNRVKEAFELMNNAIGWSRDNNLRVVIDLHILRSHHFNSKDKPLWTDPKAREKFFQLWRDLSSELKKYSVNLVAYELMNEPVADDPEDWNKLVEKAVRVIRKTEPDRKIVIGSNRWQSVDTFDQLRIPKGDRNIILSFHFYTPMLITHYKASWTGVGRYKGPVNYPGQLVDPQDIKKLPKDIAKTVRENNGIYNKDVLRELLKKPLELSRKLNLPLYCGEWGCYKAAPRQARLAWYKDVSSILEENNIAWANWDYKGGFAILKEDDQPDDDLIRVLIPK